MSNELPQGLIPKGASPVFTQDTLPAALCQEHALGPGRWGVLHLLEGAVTFVDLGSGEEREITEPGRVVIEPEAPHKLRLHEGPFSCRIDFFVQGPNEQESLVER